jgi:hypothetical protein
MYMFLLTISVLFACIVAVHAGIYERAAAKPQAVTIAQEKYTG